MRTLPLASTSPVWLNHGMSMALMLWVSGSFRVGLSLCTIASKMKVVVSRRPAVSKRNALLLQSGHTLLLP